MIANKSLIILGRTVAPGEVFDADMAEAERLIRDRLARLTPAELTTLLRGKRMVAPPAPAVGLRVINR